MNVKQTVELDITGSGMDGEGVARLDGKVVFVPYTLKGERVRAVVKSVKKNYATASVVKVLQPSPHRVEPICPHYYKCGGCDAAHVDDAYRREMIVAELKSNLKKIAGIDAEVDDFVVGRSARRNKASLPFGLVGGKIALGMYKAGTHEVIPVECDLLSERTNAVCREVLRFVNAKRMSVYDDAVGTGLLRHLVVRDIGGERISVTVVINGKGFYGERELYGALPPYVDLFVCENTKRGNVIMGDDVRLVGGEPRLKANVLGVKAELSPLSFFQVNDEVRDLLYGAVLENISAPTLIDLYSGIGITSNLAAGKCKRVVAVECVPQAVADADSTKILNCNGDVIRNICGNAQDVMPTLGAEYSGADILVDPPRKGCDAAVMTAAAALLPNKLIYVSCNHATMCRDIRVFIDAAKQAGCSYEIAKLSLFDMFRPSHHVETLICLKRE